MKYRSWLRLCPVIDHRIRKYCNFYGCCFDFVSSGAASATIIDPVSRNITQIASQPSLLSAWCASGTWHEPNGCVFAPEKVFSPTVLSLLGYLRDSTTTENGDATKCQDCCGNLSRVGKERRRESYCI